MHEESFGIGLHAFHIYARESCMIRTVTLVVMADSPKENSPFHVMIYEVTEGDYLWNTLARDEEGNCVHLQPIIDLLRDYAKEFADENPQRLLFSDRDQALTYSRKTIRRPVVIRPNPNLWYPGN